MIYDISRLLDQSLAIWPGDEPFRLSHSATISGGSTNNVGVYHGGLHFGTHIDAPYHYINDGTTVEGLSLDVYCGMAAVVDATRLSEIKTEIFEDVDFSVIKRVLVKTGAWKEHSVFPENFPVLAAGAADYLGQKGVKLVGVDVPSVDKFNGDGIPNHFALEKNKIAIIESLDLTNISPGVYELIAFPLRISGGDGSPVRAVLRDLPVSSPEGNRRLGQ